MKPNRVHVKSQAQEIVDHAKILDNNITFDDNIQCDKITIADSGTADVEFTVSHGLGRFPTHYIATLDKVGTVYDSRRSEWTTTELYLKCSAANAVIYLVIV